ncbi:MAG: EcsC family protein [Deltaproteobacteria bacterium]|nr:EcsC family protein [Deltaproteobacteria bacterium]TLN04330.1 MAG: EcsC family protein [bacterium]
MALSTFELIELRTAKQILENPGLVAKLSHLVGSPIESLLKKLPGPLHSTINSAVRKSIDIAFDIALKTLDQDIRHPSSNLRHKIAAGATGAAGGFFGLSALAIELPVSTTIMLRSIADIARSEGEDLRHPDSRLQCLQVLAFGGAPPEDDAAESTYFATRAALAKAISEAAEFVAKKGLVQKGAPVIVRLISLITSRFSIVVSEKVAAQTVPVVGAFGGAAINTLFIDHFQNMARGHFIVRRLERDHGQEEVRKLYEQL